MSNRRIVILGGYGNTGREVARLLLEHSSAELLLCGRDPARAAQAAQAWNDRFAGARVRGQAADAADGESLRRAFTGADLVVVASSTSAYVQTVAASALEAGLDYLDPQVSSRKLKLLEAMGPQIQAAGRCFVTDAGFHPGLPAVLVRYAAGSFDQLRSARVGSVIQIDWSALEFSPATLVELAEEFVDYQALQFKGGRWRSMTWLESLRPETMTFGHGFGRRYIMPMFLEELRSLPDLFPGLTEAGFFVGGFNWVVDWLILPVAMGWLKLNPRRGLPAAGRLLQWGLKRFSRPPYGTLLQLEAWGVRAGERRRMAVSVYHPDGYVLTAAPMAACLLQLLDGSARRAGLHLQGLLVDPAKMLADLQAMGVAVCVEPDQPLEAESGLR